MADDILIIGAGQAAAQAVQSLRAEGFEGPIKLFGDEPYAPYQRPPLSKKFLAGEIGYDRVELKGADFYAQSNVETHWGTRVTEIDRRAKRILTGDGRGFDYGKLIIATGSRVREINVPGFELDGVHYLRNIEDVKSIQAHFKEGAKMVVVGGGYIGLEVAAVAAKRGIAVTVLETADRVMARVVDPIVSHFYERVHREEGVKIETGVTVAGFEGTDKVEAVVSGEGKRFPCDFVVVGI
ncbi:MAG: NAD(P)/FAD-dependent oxidoreductase, partial [Parvibaculaceae bacterium]